MTRPPVQWHELSWVRPLEPAAVAALLRHWAADDRSPRIVLETRWTPGAVSNRLGFSPRQATAVLTPLRALPNARLGALDDVRAPLQLAGRVRASTRHRALRLNDPEALTRALYATGLRLKQDETLVLQVVLGPRRIPLAVPNASPSSMVQPWWSVAWMGDGGQIDGEKRAALRAKVSDHGFACSLRIGVAAAEPDRRHSLLLGLFAAIRTCEAPGLQLRLKREPAVRLNQVRQPLFWPLRLSVAELTGLTAWPLGDGELPGQGATHPRQLPPTAAVTGDRRILAAATAANRPSSLVLPTKEALHHLHVIGPTGTGKSTLLANLIAQDIAAGYSVVVIEPKGDLVDDVLGQVPSGRQDDVVVIDPHDSAPVGLNPLLAGDRRPELVADNILHLLRRLYGKNIGPRSSDILYAALLTLARRDDASLVMLPLLLTNAGIRRSLTTGIDDPLTLQPFWAGFERWSEAERAAATGPVLNKLRPLLRPGLRGVLGQRQPRFELTRVFREPTVLLVPLRRGIIGNEAADLLGSIVVAELWQGIQGRGSIARNKRRPVMIYVDEAQNYLSTFGDLADALAQARGYGVGFTLAHQFLSQFPREMRAAVLANARSRVVFQTAADDARILERGHPELSAADLTALGQYELYASLYAGGQVQPYASGRSYPPTKPISKPADVMTRSRARFGQPLDVVEQGFIEMLQPPNDDAGSTGRRRRSS